MRIFLISPASSSGKRAQVLLREAADFPLARAVRTKRGAPIGDVFAFLSGLYFRGKITYARAFAPKTSFVITPDRGLVSPELNVTAATLKQFALVDIGREDSRFSEPLLRDARRLATEHPEAQVVLLGSIASNKYVTHLTSVFGERLLFPRDFVGRGDMSRGGLLLRAARAEKELAYQPVLGAVRRGKRPPKLEPVPGILRDAVEESR
jgi:hypothetical protein